MSRYLSSTLPLRVGLVAGLWLWVATSPQLGWAQDEGPLKGVPEYEALARDYKILKVVEADLDGDDRKDSLVVFKDRQEDSSTGGGFLVFRMKSGSMLPAGCLYLEDLYPADLSASGKEVVITLARGGRSGDGPGRLTLVVGKDVGLRGEPGDLLAGMKITASSTLRTEPADVKFVYDQDVDTSWAEGAAGTGIGESLTFEFKKPVGMGLVGVFPGKGTGAKDFRDFNRIHRAVLELNTQSTTGDTSANLDFADLGIDLTGNKMEVSFANRPEMKFIKVSEPEVVKIVLRIDSVYLGDRKDDTHVAEVFLCPMLGTSEIQARLKKKAKSAN